MRRIHPTAVIDPAAELADEVEVGPYCVIEGPVRVGRGTKLKAHVTLMGDTTIGDANVIWPGAVLGAAPQDLKHTDERTTLVIGDRNQIREHVTFHPGTAQGGGVTTIGSGGLFMVGCHVAHDGRVGNGVVLANHVLLAGHATIGDRAVLNGACACHHFTTVGRLAYVGGLSRMTHDVPPFCIAEGHDIRVRAANVVGMRRAGIPAGSVAILRDAIHDIFVSERETSSVAIARLLAEHPQEPLLAELVAFMRASDQGRHGRAAERRAEGPLPTRGVEPSAAPRAP